MAIKKVPKNFDNNLNRRKQHLNEVIDALNNVTDVVANPEGTATEELENLQIGDAIYSVNKPNFEFIKALRLTIANGGEYRTDKPKIEFYDDGGNVLSIAASEYVASCDKSYAGNINLDNVCSVATSDAPGAFTYVFNNNLEVSNFHLIKLTRAGAFVGDIAKNIKLELSSNGTDFITLWEDPAIVWTDATPYRIIDIKTGNVSNTLLPIVTSADNGKVLGVVDGNWNMMNVPSELPDAYNHIRIVNREIAFSGAWSKNTTDPTEIVFTGSLDTSKFKAYGRKPFGAEIDITNDFGSNQDLCNYPNTTIEFDFELSGLKITVIPISSMNKIRKGSLQLSGSFKYVGVMFDPVDKNYGIMGEVSITFSSDFSTVTITVST